MFLFMIVKQYFLPFAWKSSKKQHVLFSIQVCKTVSHVYYTLTRRLTAQLSYPLNREILFIDRHRHESLRKARFNKSEAQREKWRILRAIAVKAVAELNRNERCNHVERVWVRLGEEISPLNRPQSNFIAFCSEECLSFFCSTLAIKPPRQVTIVNFFAMQRVLMNFIGLSQWVKSRNWFRFDTHKSRRCFVDRPERAHLPPISILHSQF